MLGSTVVQTSDGQGDGVEVDTFDGARRRDVPFWPRGFNRSNLRSFSRVSSSEEKVPLLALWGE